MIQIKEKQKCSGCASCVQKCPIQCITLREDNEGFLYPLVDHTLCIDCGLCEKVCPILSPFDETEPLQVLAAINIDEKIRMESSSGGIFTILAEFVINEGGVVFGARFDDEWQVTLDYTETIEGLAAFRGSKYVQARTGDTYKQCEKFLKDGRKVLYTGSPCQIAGLHHFLRKEYDKLMTCDFVCHGVPSPKVWRMYLREVIASTDEAIQNVEFRNKNNGWKRFNFVLDSNRTTISSYHQDNHYMKAFLQDMILRPSCYNCQAKCGKSKADITIADYWGINKTHPEMDDDKGTSLIIINTSSGEELFDAINILKVATSYKDAKLNNKGLGSITIPHFNRSIFFEKLDSRKSVIDWIDICVYPLHSKRNIIMHPFTSILNAIKLHWGR